MCHYSSANGTRRQARSSFAAIRSSSVALTQSFNNGVNRATTLRANQRAPAACALVVAAGKTFFDEKVCEVSQDATRSSDRTKWPVQPYGFPH